MNAYKLIIYDRIQELSEKIDRKNKLLYAAVSVDDKMRISRDIASLEASLHFNSAIYYDTGEVQWMLSTTC